MWFATTIVKQHIPAIVRGCPVLLICSFEFLACRLLAFRDWASTLSIRPLTHFRGWHSNTAGLIQQEYYAVQASHPARTITMATSWWKRAIVALAASNLLTLHAAAQQSSPNATGPSSNTTANSNSTLVGDVGALFVTPTRDLAFAMRVPADKSSQDIYFTMVMSLHVMWGAIGFGSSQMAGSLMLVMYGSSTGQNITLSPRIAGPGHSEPWYSPDIRVEALPGTDRNNGTAWVYNGVCRNCRSWSTPSGGRLGLDVASRSQDMIYATGESGDIWSDDLAQPLRVHMNFGTFAMDMTRTTGTAQDDEQDAASLVPQVNMADSTPELVGTVQGSISVTKYREWKGLLHAVIMVLCFVGLLPFGTFVLRLGGWVRAHAAVQGFAGVLVIVGAGLGMSMSGMYNRSRNFNTPHQIIGLFVFIFVLGQFTLGLVNHRAFKKTQQKTKLAPVHVWLGRLTILLGIINAFLGFTLSQAVFYNYILAGLVLFIFPLLAVILVLKKCVQKRMGSSSSSDNNKPGEDGDNANGGGGYEMEPWRNLHQQQQQQPAPAYSAGAGNGFGGVGSYAAPPPTYQHQHQNPHPHPLQGNVTGGGMGPQQSTREYV
ncbi:uncharacterized protein B0I36DRAFT_329768 [Microdochium trichocladiopsis]|uniref:Cytochrome b561 domain-containing protein n=1 Tax=Microdochium trichocladiopsis TaxID=1682393 RepID=A0A9P8Y2L7_9PEZI|nr:uncharacterized protein B0I36DRAFT_329768 [Microdochium trichocladiopsis]KAH7026047.1 hypothetical protein B0I36DRAFT_329768 [Microdochium trichocladiopsis]